MTLPKSILSLIESFEKLPGVGPKTAQRLAFYLLRVPQAQLDEFGEALSSLKKKTKLCSFCRNLDETDPCRICSDQSRNKKLLCVVEQPLDLLALENTKKFSGVYHVLHGAIEPLNNIGPDEIYLKDLLDRVKEDEPEEIIFATNPTLEGEATSMYIESELSKIGYSGKITRLARGLPTGGDLEYADELTLANALEGRK